MDKTKYLSAEEAKELISTLKARFEKNMNRHVEMNWTDVESKLISESMASKLWSLHEMEKTGGEPDVISQDQKPDEYIYYDYMCIPCVITIL